jgi:hypothetical protein
LYPLWKIFSVKIGTISGKTVGSESGRILCIRFVSEFLRADFRGAGNISGYQFLSLIALLVPFCLTVFLPPESFAVHPNLSAGASLLWNPLTLLLLQLLWLTVFLYTGRSMVTGSTLNFHVYHHLV